MRRTISVAAALVLALGVAACSSDDSTDTSSTESSAAESTTGSTTESSEAASAEMDIVDTAVAAGDFTTLATALTEAELVETLKGDGPFTVFAPTDEAFAALPDGTLDTLLEDPTGDLAGILTYHVVPGSVMAADVVTLDGQEVETVNGASITVNVDGDTVSLTDASGNTVNVTATDIEASNGVIHVIDGVLLP
jgi:uncharacterized surface protein with fasciclin (FAS1) repeats